MLCWITISAGMKPVSTTESRVSEPATWGVDIFTLEFDRFPGVRFVDSKPQSLAYDKTHYAIYKRPRLSMGKLGNNNVKPHRVKVNLSMSFSPSGRLSAWSWSLFPCLSFCSLCRSVWLALSLCPCLLLPSLYSYPYHYYSLWRESTRHTGLIVMSLQCTYRKFEFHTIWSFSNELLAMRAYITYTSNICEFKISND